MLQYDAKRHDAVLRAAELHQKEAAEAHRRSVKFLAKGDDVGAVWWQAMAQNHARVARELMGLSDA